MTDEAKKIAGVFERCECGYCFPTCPYHGEEKCLRHLFADAADLIERMDAEIERLKALDRHGRWITRFTGDEYVTFCSWCKEEANEMADYCLEYNYCPNCGAKMDKEEEKIDG